MKPLTTFLVALLGAAVPAGVLGFAGGTECPGEFGKFGLVITFMLLGAVAAVLLAVGLIALFMRQRVAAIVMIGIAIGLVAGYIVGAWIGNQAPSRCPPAPPEVARESSGMVEARLFDSFEATLRGSVACTVIIETGEAVSISGTVATADGSLEMELWGMPTAIGTSGQDYFNFDVIILDGLPAPGYRPTRSDQVTTDPSGPLAGTTRLREVPLLADTGSSGSPPSLNADIEWQCDPLP